MSLPADLVVLDLDFFPEHLLKLTHGVWCDGVPLRSNILSWVQRVNEAGNPVSSFLLRKSFFSPVRLPKLCGTSSRSFRETTKVCTARQVTIFLGLRRLILTTAQATHN